MQTQEFRQADKHSSTFQRVAVVLANQPSSGADLSNSLLAEVGALPVVLRAILSAKSAGADHIIVAVDPVNGAAIRRRLAMTKRLPNSVEWVEAAPECAIPIALGQAATYAERVIVITGDRSYHPSLYRMVSEWRRDRHALELTWGDKPIGLTVLSQELAGDIAMNGGAVIHDVDDLHLWLLLLSCQVAGLDRTTVEYKTVPDELWQAIATEEDRAAAEQKLDRWLVKPTDGIFARMNRKVSIPISRQLIKFPITPNMVSLFTLGVSLAAGLYFAFGGYWNALIGAVLSVWASILDGCDGEVARLKLQVSALGCWIDTVCDYLYYIFIFAGMTIGLTRSMGERRFLGWGAALFLGAITTFIITALGRKQLSGAHPEQYLAVWHKKAESRLSNPLIYIGRYTEFIVRRCFLPYALLALAVLNFTPAALYASAIGANVAWIIALRSYIAFSTKQRSATAPVVASAPAMRGLTV